MIDDRDLNRTVTGFELQAELGLDGVKDTGAGVEAGVTVDGADEADVEGARDAGSVDDRAAGDTREEIGELAKAAGAAQVGDVARRGRHAEIRVEVEGCGLAGVNGMQFETALGDDEIVDRHGAGFVVRGQLEAIDEKSAQHGELSGAGLRRGTGGHDVVASLVVATIGFLGYPFLPQLLRRLRAKFTRESCAVGI